MRLPPSMKRCCGDGRDVCVSLEPKLLLLDRIAAEAPQYKEQVEELRDVVLHHRSLCEAILAYEQEQTEK